MRNEAPALFRKNLSALSTIDPGLAGSIERSAPNRLLSFQTARSGAKVPVLLTGAGEQPFHSLVDPGKEAVRLVESLGQIGYLVCLGLGAGSVAAAFLRLESASGILVIEKDPSTLKSLLENVDMASVLSDTRVRVTVGLGGIRTILRSTYTPAVSGDLASLGVRPWCAFEREFFDAAAAELREAAEEARADYNVQAAFGKRWFANMLANLPVLEKVPERQLPEPWKRTNLAHVTAAGPSLDRSLAALCARADSSVVI
ncbi:MAG TPA: hypothetical protein VMM82_06910, partial [Spirochaetia bacterium]|nr:hypothetical protein [Spirochaetia bacterium]